LLSLDSDSPGLVLRQRSADLQRLFPDDPVVSDLAPRLIEATRNSDEEVASLCNALKGHIADSYRIHQRLIRSRRIDAKGWEFMPRGPAAGGPNSLSHVRIEADPNERMEALAATLEDWRFAAREAILGDDDAASRRIAARYLEMLEAISVGNRAFFTTLVASDLAFEGEEEFLVALREFAVGIEDVDRIETMMQSTQRLLKLLGNDVAHPRIVAFATATEVATAFHAALKSCDDGVQVYLLINGDNDEKISSATKAFVSSNASAILVTDRCGEEGLNLTCADAIIHLDLPFSSVRIEQRIGRLDRFGRRQSNIRHRIFLPSDDDTCPWQAWFNFLATGFQIFNRSISDVQFLLEEIENRALTVLFEEGPLGLMALAKEVEQLILEERRSQDEQYALDRIALAEEPIETYLQVLEGAEEDEDALETAVDRWLIGVLQFRKRPFSWPQEDPFKFDLNQNVLVPRSPWLTEFGVDATSPLTWRRRIATKRPDVTLLRPGTPLIDVTERFSRWDDRGTAFVTWRAAQEWTAEPWIGFRLCFVVEPNIEISDLLAPTHQDLARVRRAQRYFRPFYRVMHVDVNGDPVLDQSLLAILERPYDGNEKSAIAKDLNLGSRPHLLEEIIDAASFQNCCRAARDVAHSALSDLPDVKAQIEIAGQAARADIVRYRNRMARRSSTGDELAKNDIAMIESILPSVLNPAIRLDAMGCFVIANYGPRNVTHA